MAIICISTTLQGPNSEYRTKALLTNDCQQHIIQKQRYVDDKRDKSATVPPILPDKGKHIVANEP